MSQRERGVLTNCLTNKYGTVQELRSKALLAIANQLILILVCSGFRVCVCICEFACGSDGTLGLVYFRYKKHTPKKHYDLELLRN